MISIIVPVYRAENSIQKCVESLTSQDYRQLEIILVDDGSPDNSGKICDELAKQDGRIKVIHKPNGGVSSSRNAGIDAAKGDYVAFVDSDDYVEPDYISKMCDVLKNSEEERQAWCCLQTVSGYNKENPVPNFTSDKETQVFHRKEIMTLHEMWVDAGPCNKLFKTDIIKAHGLKFDETLSLGEDLLFNWQYIDVMGDTKICVVTKPLYNYVRVGGDSLDSKYRADMLEIYKRINSECEAYLKKWNVSEEALDKFYNSCYFSYEKVMRNNMRAPELSFGKKIKKNTEIIKSSDFQEIYGKITCRIHPAYTLAYKLKSYFLINLLDRLYDLKSGKRKG